MFSVEVKEQAACAIWALSGATSSRQRYVAEQIGIPVLIEMLLRDSEKLQLVGQCTFSCFFEIVVLSTLAKIGCDFKRNLLILLLPYYMHQKPSSLWYIHVFNKRFTNYPLPTIHYQLSITNYLLTTTYYQLSNTNYPLPTIHYQLSFTNYPLPTIHYQLPITNYPLPTIHHQLPIMNYLLPIIHYQLSFTNYPLPTIYYQLSITNYPLPTIHYQLPITNDPLPTIHGCRKNSSCVH